MTSPIEVIPSVFISDFEHAKNFSFLKELDIKKVISVCHPKYEMPHLSQSEFQQYIDLKIARETVPLKDDIITSLEEAETILAKMDRISKIISQCVEKKINILVHCVHGHSRSPAAVAYHMMKTQKSDLRDCFKMIQLRHVHADIRYTNGIAYWIAKLGSH
jgi:protein-tyrosine phosphatase